MKLTARKSMGKPFSPWDVCAQNPRPAMAVIPGMVIEAICGITPAWIGLLPGSLFCIWGTFLVLMDL